MGIVQRKSTRVTALMIGGVLLAYLNVLLIFPKTLTPEQIGVLRQIISGPSLLISVLLFGVNAVAVRYFPRIKNDKALFQRMLSYVLTVPLLLAIIISSVYYIWFQEITQWIGYTGLAFDFAWMFIPMLLLLGYVQIFLALLNNLMMLEVSNFFTNFWIRIYQFSFIGLYALGFISFKMAVVGTLAAYTIQVLAMMIIFLRATKLKISFGFGFVKDKIFKEAFPYSMYMTLNSGGSFFVQSLDVTMTGSLLGMYQSGVYTTCMFMAMIIELPRRAISQTIVPLIAEDFKNNDDVAIKEKYIKTSLTQFIIGGFMFIALWVNIDNVFDLMPNGDKFREGKYVVLFVGLSRVYDMVWGANGEILGLSKFYRWNTILMVFLIGLAYFSNLYFIKEYGITGTALATLVTVMIYNTFRGIVLFAYMKMLPFTWKHLSALALMSIPILINYYLLPELDNLYVDIFIKLLVILVFGLLPVYFFKVSVDLNKMVVKYFNMVFKRK